MLYQNNDGSYFTTTLGNGAGKEALDIVYRNGTIYRFQDMANVRALSEA